MKGDKPNPLKLLMKGQNEIHHKMIRMIGTGSIHHPHHVTMTVTGTTVIFNNVPDHQLEWTGGVVPREVPMSIINYANLIIVHTMSGETRIIKNRWGTTGEVC